MPYDDRPGAYWLLVADGEPALRRTVYDLDAAAERSGGLPGQGDLAGGSWAAGPA